LGIPVETAAEFYLKKEKEADNPQAGPTEPVYPDGTGKGQLVDLGGRAPANIGDRLPALQKLLMAVEYYRRALEPPRQI
jgi:hypothetical protein